MNSVSHGNVFSANDLARRVAQSLEEELPLARKIATGEAIDEERERYWRLNNQPNYEGVDHWMDRLRQTLEYIEQSEHRYHDTPELAYQYANLEAYRDSLYEHLFQEAYQLSKLVDQATGFSDWRMSPPILDKVGFLRQVLASELASGEPAVAHEIDKAIVDAVQTCDSRYRKKPESTEELVDSRSPSMYSYEHWAATRFLERYVISTTG